MIGLDTNVMVRYLAQDDKEQSREATRLIEDLTEEEPALLSLVVVVETVWVMEELYGASRARVAEIIEQLLRVRTFIVDDAEIAWQALSGYRKTSADFADHVIARSCTYKGCQRIMTFDKKAARDCGMTLLRS